MKKRGFTLIELLAVIVILAVIALIVTPVITGIIKETKDSADLRSAEEYVKAGENYFASSTLNNKLLNTNVINSLELSSSPATGSVIVNSDGTIEMAIVINDKCYRKSVSQSIKDIEVSTDIINCSIDENIYSVVLAAYPFLKTGEDGCETLDDTKNYSYMGGCYLKGAQSNNYLWYSGFIWRIMGINSDNTIRLITEENVAGISYNGNSSLLKDSSLDKWLNNYFYYNLDDDRDSVVTTGLWCERGTDYITSSALAVRTSCTTTISNKVGTLSLDEYNLAGDNKYLNTSQEYFTITPYSDKQVFNISNRNYATTSYTYSMSGFRPIINVNSTTSVKAGDGNYSTSTPYILSSSKSNDVTGKLSTVAVSGDYITFASKLYRVVSINSDGSTKLILDDYYKDTDGNNITTAFGTTGVYDSSSTLYQKLNGDVLNWLVPSTDTSNRDKMVDSTWYSNKYNWNDNYTVSLNETTPTTTSTGLVGSIRAGEMLSGQSITILNKTASDYWTITQYADSTNSWRTLSTGRLYKDVYTNTQAIRPVIVIKSDVSVTSGTGLSTSPYQI